MLLIHSFCYYLKYSFEDEEVLDPGFKQKLGDMVRVMRPFVHWFVLIFFWLMGVVLSL